MPRLPGPWIRKAQIETRPVQDPTPVIADGRPKARSPMTWVNQDINHRLTAMESVEGRRASGPEKVGPESSE